MFIAHQDPSWILIGTVLGAALGLGLILIAKARK